MVRARWVCTVSAAVGVKGRAVERVLFPSFPTMYKFGIIDSRCFLCVTLFCFFHLHLERERVAAVSSVGRVLHRAVQLAEGEPERHRTMEVTRLKLQAVSNLCLAI